MWSGSAPLKASYDGLMVCNGYLVLRIGTDLSVPKSEWLEVGCLAMVKDGRAELMCPAFILEKYRERVARETGKPCPGPPPPAWWGEASRRAATPQLNTGNIGNWHHFHIGNIPAPPPTNSCYISRRGAERQSSQSLSPLRE